MAPGCVWIGAAESGGKFGGKLGRESRWGGAGEQVSQVQGGGARTPDGAAVELADGRLNKSFSVVCFLHTLSML